jgi:hypothetical protein
MECRLIKQVLHGEQTIQSKKILENNMPVNLLLETMEVGELPILSNQVKSKMKERKVVGETMTTMILEEINMDRLKILTVVMVVEEVEVEEEVEEMAKILALNANNLVILLENAQMNLLEMLQRVMVEVVEEQEDLKTEDPENVITAIKKVICQEIALNHEGKEMMEASHTKDKEEMMEETSTETTTLLPGTLKELTKSMQAGVKMKTTRLKVMIGEIQVDKIKKILKRVAGGLITNQASQMTKALQEAGDNETIDSHNCLSLHFSQVHIYIKLLL